MDTETFLPDSAVWEKTLRYMTKQATAHWIPALGDLFRLKLFMASALVEQAS